MKSYSSYRKIVWDACHKRWIKGTELGGWDEDQHEHRVLDMEDVEMYGETVNADTDLSGKYAVWCPTATEPPRVVYSSKPEAIKAAYAMAHKYPGGRFCVMKVEGVAQIQTVKYVDFTTSKPKKKVTK